MTARKPIKMKIIHGTDQPCRRPESELDLPLVDSLPDAPDWLPNAHAVKEWEKLTGILFGAGVLTEAGLGPLAHLCAIHGTLVHKWSSGFVPSASDIAQYRTLSNDFGLTPVSQTKVPSGDRGGKRENPFASKGNARGKEA